ncbi:PRA1 family protein F3-like [Cynara cardunculus var. scolymus]|uniref:PRA1 family protein F3-like n=1 Tax=Cynara cardunculus var. scolymus TaxID=59895 RepID=UPI000D627CD1|nr:PRA1 family protein F3-like [Cynara cardunculus var. scolymus]
MATTSTGGDLKVRLIISPAKQRFQTAFGTKRLWKEMFNLHSINLPRGLSDAISRIKTNVGYFRMNYTLFTFMVLFLSLLWHPISLMALAIASWLFCNFILRDESLVICNRTIDDRVTLAILSVVTFVLLLLDEATMNILLSVSIGMAVTVVHTVLRKTEDLCLDENDVVEGAGYLPAKLPIECSINTRFQPSVC